MFTKSEKRDNKLWLAGYGNTEAKIMIVVSHPLREDLVAQGILLEGEAADEVKNALKIAGIKEDDCWFTSVVKYGIGSKDKPTAAQVNECADILDEEIAEIKPKLIITLGAEPFKRIMKQNIKQGDYIGEIIESSYGPVMTNYSPANVYLIDPKLRPAFIENFELAKRFIDGKLKYQPYEYIVVEDPKVNTEILQHYIDNGMMSIGYDAEWLGSFMKNEVMYSFQYSCEPHKAVVLPIIKEDGTENLELLETMKLILEHPSADRLGWNIRVDDNRLRQRGFSLPDKTLGFDGMKAVAYFDSRWRKGLETGIKKFTNYRPHYNDFNIAKRKHKVSHDNMSEMYFKDKKAFFDYCAGDAVSHREACINMREEMKKSVPKKVRDYYFNVYLPLSVYLGDMELAGIPIDLDCMEEITQQYTACYNALETKLSELTKKLGFDTAVYDKAMEANNGDEAAVRALGIYKDFNPRSSADKRLLFFDIMGLTPAYYVKKSKAKPRAWWEKQKPHMQAQYKPSANGKSIASIRFTLAEELKKDPNNEELKNKYEVIKTYLDLARVSVFAKKFLNKQGTDFADFEGEETSIVFEDGNNDNADGEDGDPLKSSYWAALCKDNRIHASFYECLDNFRASSRVNVQNPASKVLSHIPAIFKELNMEPPKNIRNIFYSGHPDWYFAEVDVAGADLAIAAFLSRDPDYIRDIRNGGFHVTKMRDYFNDKTLGKDDASKYVTSKAITFRVAYTAGLMSAALPIQAEIYAESGNLVDLSVITYALKTWERYGTYMEYREKCQNMAIEQGYIINERGMIYQFGETKNFSVLAGWANQALAFPIASELALHLWQISVSIRKRLIKDGVWLKYCYPINTVHDASYWIIHKDLMKDKYFEQIVYEEFCINNKIATNDTLGIEMVISDRWKGKEKIYSAETKWDFEKGLWVLDH